VRGFILALWLHQDGPEKARKRLELTMQLLADGIMTPPKGDVKDTGGHPTHCSLLRHMSM
jgi:hypothetical protein